MSSDAHAAPPTNAGKVYLLMIGAILCVLAMVIVTRFLEGVGADQKECAGNPDVHKCVEARAETRGGAQKVAGAMGAVGLVLVGASMAIRKKG